MSIGYMIGLFGPLPSDLQFIDYVLSTPPSKLAEFIKIAEQLSPIMGISQMEMVVDLVELDDRLNKRITKADILQLQDRLIEYELKAVELDCGVVDESRDKERKFQKEQNKLRQRYHNKHTFKKR